MQQKNTSFFTSEKTLLFYYFLLSIFYHFYHFLPSKKLQKTSKILRQSAPHPDGDQPGRPADPRLGQLLELHPAVGPDAVVVGRRHEAAVVVPPPRQHDPGVLVREHVAAGKAVVCLW